MALFGSPRAFLGLDIGTSSLKLVELIDRHKRTELTTYAEANFPNKIVNQTGNSDKALRETATVIAQMIEKAHVSAELAVAALPSSVVFSTVLTLPDMPESEMDRAVHFAARDVVPANLSDMVLGWNRLGVMPHMDTAQKTAPTSEKEEAKNDEAILSESTQAQTLPVFVTAAPKQIVERYTLLMTMLNLQLHALEVETLPLARSLLAKPTDSALIVDLGDTVTTYHVIDAGTPRVSHTIEYGGRHLTKAIASSLKLGEVEAEQQKARFGLLETAPALLREALLQGLREIITAAQHVLETYAHQSKAQVNRTILIGGGANLPGLEQYWTEKVNSAAIGNPWRGLAYPQELDQRLHELGPKYGVAVGLALRGFIAT